MNYDTLTKGGKKY